MKMAMASEEKKNIRKPERLHHVILENRGKLSISGVEEVDSFDEEKIVLFTTMGLLEIRGAGLHISHLNVESGEIAVEGNIYTLDYSDEDSKRMTLLQKLFR